MKWIDQCNEWKSKWEDEGLKTNNNDSKYSIYEVMDIINTYTNKKHIIMTDAGSPSYVCPVNLKNKFEQRFIFNPSQADMGWALPASIGVSLANKDKIIVPIIGDGSFMSNIQELAVITNHGLPIKIILLNNGGYLSIKNTQNKFYNNRVHGVGEGNGLYFPDIEKLANSFDICYAKYSKYNNSTFGDTFNHIMNNNISYIIEFECREIEEIIPYQNFKLDENGNRFQAGLDDMFPFLDEQELMEEKNVTKL